VTIVFGLTFATLLVLIVVPVLYAIFYKVEVEEQAQTGQRAPNLGKGE